MFCTYLLTLLMHIETSISKCYLGLKAAKESSFVHEVDNGKCYIQEYVHSKSFVREGDHSKYFVQKDVHTKCFVQKDVQSKCFARGFPEKCQVCYASFGVMIIWSSQLHVTAALPPGQEPSVPIT